MINKKQEKQMAMIKIGSTDSPGKAMAKGIRAGLKAIQRKRKAIQRKRKAKEKSKIVYDTPPPASPIVYDTPPEPSKIACPDCGKDQIEHSNGFVCACAVRKVIAK